MQFTVIIPDDKLLYLDDGIRTDQKYRADNLPPLTRESYVQGLVDRQLWALENFYVPDEEGN